MQIKGFENEAKGCVITPKKRKYFTNAGSTLHPVSLDYCLYP